MIDFSVEDMRAAVEFLERNISQESAESYYRLILNNILDEESVEAIGETRSIDRAVGMIRTGMHTFRNIEGLVNKFMQVIRVYNEEGNPNVNDELQPFIKLLVYMKATDQPMFAFTDEQYRLLENYVERGEAVVRGGDYSDVGFREKFQEANKMLKAWQIKLRR